MLTSKQKSYLRSLAQTEPALFQIGKEGLSDNLIQTVDDALRTHELVKIKLLKTGGDDVDEIIFDLAMNTKSEVVQKIGSVFVL